jgi:SNF2 family DNA or RNA helicase
MSNVFVIRLTVKQVNNMKLQNTVMQLRKVCSHPFLFDWPLDPVTHQAVLNEDLVNVSGKMMVLDRLLRELFSRKHKVLLFSQFTTMLDIIEVMWDFHILFLVIITDFSGLGLRVYGMDNLSH